MKLSDIKGERTLDVIADIIDPIANIAEDEDAAALFKKAAVPPGVEKRVYLISRLRRSVPKLLKAHKGDIITIMAALEGVDSKAYAASLNLAKLISDLADLMTDDEFVSFFTSSADSSGSAPGTFAAAL